MIKYLLAFLCLATLGGAAANTRETLDGLCKIDKAAPRVTKISEVKEMIKALEEQQVACEPRIAEAIKALKPIVELETVCSLAAANAIVDYWRNYVRRKAGGRKYLPKQLKKFFIAYSLQVSKLCKTTMIEQLAAATNERQISDKDIKLVTAPFEKNIDELFGADMRLENLLAVIQAYRQNEEIEMAKSKVAMEPLRMELHRRTRERCSKKFKPIYDTLIAPIVRLIAIGINYRGEIIDSRMISFQNEQLYRDWFVAVFACEATASFGVVSIPKAGEDTEGNSKMITFLDEEDVAELEKKGLLVEEAPLEEAQDYVVAAASVGDLIVDDHDEDLAHSMKKYGSFLKETNKFRLRLMKKLPFLMKKYANSKAVQFGLHPSKTKAKALSTFGRRKPKYEPYRAPVQQLHKTSAVEYIVGWLIVLITVGAIGAVIAGAILTHGAAFIAIIIFGSLGCLALIALSRDMLVLLYS